MSSTRPSIWNPVHAGNKELLVVPNASSLIRLLSKTITNILVLSAKTAHERYNNQDYLAEVFVSTTMSTKTYLILFVNCIMSLDCVIQPTLWNWHRDYSHSKSALFQSCCSAICMHERTVLIDSRAGENTAPAKQKSQQNNCTHHQNDLWEKIFQD